MDSTTLAMFARLIVSLGVVMGLMWAAAHIMKKKGMGPATRRPGVDVEVELLARKAMGRNSSIVVVRVGDQSMVVGVTEHQITKLADTEVHEIELHVEEDATSRTGAPGSNGSTPAWTAMFEQLREKTVRK